MNPVRLPELTPENGLIFRITHIRNVPWILDRGLHCANSGTRDPNFVPIGNPSLIEKRMSRPVPIPPGGSLSDYVPFYFTPLTPMLFNIKTGFRVAPVPMAEIVAFQASIRTVVRGGARVVIADSHAFLATADFTEDLVGLDGLDWARLQAGDFQRRGDEPERFDRYQAEALVHRHLPVTSVDRLVCYGRAQRDELVAEIARRNLALKVEARPDWLFG